eukprot:5696523-Pleurochrysis_carterae.AAC.1
MCVGCDLRVALAPEPHVLFKRAQLLPLLERHHVARVTRICEEAVGDRDEIGDELEARGLNLHGAEYGGLNRQSSQILRSVHAQRHAGSTLPSKTACAVWPCTGDTITARKKRQAISSAVRGTRAAGARAAMRLLPDRRFRQSCVT